jgi:hypothetical protein
MHAIQNQQPRPTTEFLASASCSTEVKRELDKWLKWSGDGDKVQKAPPHLHVRNVCVPDLARFIHEGDLGFGIGRA